MSGRTTDRVYSYKLDKNSGKLSANGFVQANPGAGPRHFDFHPNGRWVYVINEEASTLDFMAYDAAAGSLTLQQTISSLPAAFEGTDYTSEIHVTADGRFIYAANRLHNSIALFSIDAASGAPTLQDGTVVVIAGNSNPGYAGDGQLATTALLNVIALSQITS